MRVLLIGDFHVPDRAKEFPLEILNSVNMESRKKKFDMVICTGDLTKVKMVRPTLFTWSNKVSIVQGNMDYDMRNAIHFPRKIVLNTSEFYPDGKNINIGVVHGHQVHPRGDANGLAKIAGDLEAHILISGHTHAPAITKKEIPSENRTILLVNPGSASGAWSFVASLKPTYMIMTIEPFEEEFLIKLDIREFYSGKLEQQHEEYKFINNSIE